MGDGLGRLSAGAGVSLLEAGGFSWSTDLTLTSDRPEDRPDALAGLGRRGFDVFAGSTLAYRMGPLEAFRHGRGGARGPHGYDRGIGLNLAKGLGERWFVGAGTAAALTAQTYVGTSA